MIGSFCRKIRTKQVGLLGRAFSLLHRNRLSSRFVGAIGRLPLVSRILVGHQRSYASRAEAEAQAAVMEGRGHNSPDAVSNHMRLGESLRISDYPVLFHLSQVLPQLTRLLDVGGNAGNLFYSYSRHLRFREDFVWTVIDLPEVAREGQRIAESRGERQLRFVVSFSDVAPVDVILFSGSLHYFEQVPAEILAGAAGKARYIIVNRSPVINAAPRYAIQDGGTYCTVAKMIEREALLRTMTEAGYILADEWSAPELKAVFPLDPDHSAPGYSGLLFCLSEVESAAVHSEREGPAQAHQ